MVAFSIEMYGHFKVEVLTLWLKLLSKKPRVTLFQQLLMTRNQVNATSFLTTNLTTRC